MSRANPVHRETQEDRMLAQLLTSPTLHRSAAGLALCIALAGCSTTQPLPYSGVASSSKMRISERDATGRIPYEYKTATDWEKYAAFIVEPVVVYRGSDNQFEEISDENKAHLARYMQSRFSEKLSTRLRKSKVPGDDTLRIRLTLTGAKANTAVLSTFTRFDLLGGPYNAVQAVRGKEGAMTGSVSFAVEIYDSASNELLGAYVAKQYPNAWNLKAGIGAMSASEVGIDNGAEQLMAYLR
jgi:hypothetical protein